MITTLDEFANNYYIIVLIDNAEKNKLNLIKEGLGWQPSSESDYLIRVDTPKNNTEQLHAHIARKKHSNTKSKQVAWNKDGTRHDKKSFNQNFNGMSKAKEIARNALGLSPDIIFEEIDNYDIDRLSIESDGNSLTENYVFVFQVVQNILKS
jgi:Family of unknown function (DUF6367)